jgi:excisionase family DNA binding protein
MFQTIPVVLNNLISVKEAAEWSGYSLQYLRRLLRRGTLEGIKIGQVWLIEKEILDIYMKHGLNSVNQRFCPKKKIFQSVL